MHPELIPVAEASAVNRARFASICRSLDAAELVAPVPGTHWRVRDYIAHIASIDIWVGPWFEAWANHEEFSFAGDGDKPFNIDEWNDDRINERKETPLEELLAEAAERRIGIERTMARFDDETLAREMKFRRSNITFLRYLQTRVAHDPQHMADMVAGLPDRHSDAELVEWLAKHRVGPAAKRQ